jgi:hypothetical protein
LYLWIICGKLNFVRLVNFQKTVNITNLFLTNKKSWGNLLTIKKF